jgi:nitrate reductase NapD
MSGLNISGVLVHVRLAKLDQVRQDLVRMPGVEIHGQSEDGRLIVTVEDTEAGRSADTVTGFANIDGVLSAALVYQHTDTNEPLEESAQ